VTCPDCKSVIVPPRSYCGICYRQLDEWVEVGPEGVVENYTVAHIRLEKGEVIENTDPVLIGMIKLEGATSLLPGIVRGIAPEELTPGLRVRAVFRDPPEDSLHDLDHFEPV
jgi:uncharacterized OB-fold protein